MANSRQPPATSGRWYEVETTFRAPIEFAFRWCTDYSPADPRIERDTYTRRILSRGRRTVVYQDLGDHAGGWFLNLQTVTLHPPSYWHAESVGNYRTWSIDYRLRALPDGTTRFRFRGFRTPTPLDKDPPRADAVQENLRELWQRFGRALEADYRRSRRVRARSGRGPSFAGARRR